MFEPLTPERRFPRGATRLATAAVLGGVVYAVVCVLGVAVDASQDRFVVTRFSLVPLWHGVDSAPRSLLVGFAIGPLLLLLAIGLRRALPSALSRFPASAPAALLVFAVQWYASLYAWTHRYELRPGLFAYVVLPLGAFDWAGTGSLVSFVATSATAWLVDAVDGRWFRAPAANDDRSDEEPRAAAALPPAAVSLATAALVGAVVHATAFAVATLRDVRGAAFMPLFELAFSPAILAEALRGFAIGFFLGGALGLVALGARRTLRSLPAAFPATALAAIPVFAAQWLLEANYEAYPTSIPDDSFLHALLPFAAMRALGPLAVASFAATLGTGVFADLVARRRVPGVLGLAGAVAAVAVVAFAPNVMRASARVRVVGKGACVSSRTLPDGRVAIGVDVNLGVQNVGPMPIVVSTERPWTTAYRVAPTIEALDAQPFAPVGDGSGGVPGGPPATRYETLDYGRYVKVPGSVSAVVPAASAGTWVYLELVAESRRPTDEELREARERAGGYAVAWTEPLRSEPIAVDVPASVETRP